MTTSTACRGDALDRCGPECWSGEVLPDDQRKLTHHGQRVESRVFVEGAMVGNGAPLPMGRAVAQAVTRALAQPPSDTGEGG